MELKNLKKFFEGYIKKVVEDMRKVLEGTRLRDKLEPYVEESEGKIEAGVKMPEYAKWADTGRRPGKRPPFKPIEEWVAYKRFQFRDKKGRFLSYKRTAFLVAKGIGEHGTKGRNFMRLIYDANLMKASDIAFSKDVAIALNNRFVSEGLNSSVSV